VIADPPQVTVVVPSLNQGRFLADALDSTFSQSVPVEVFVMDAGSSDETIDVLRAFEHKLAGWRSKADRGQAAAINDGVAMGSAPYVCWLNSDDWWLDHALETLVTALNERATVAFAYGNVWNVSDPGGNVKPVWVSPFNRVAMAKRCLVSQPGTLIRRQAWEQVGGLDESLRMAMDYDLWWRLINTFGAPCYVSKYVAVNRDHEQTKTNSARRLHYVEAKNVVQRHYGRIPLKWYLAHPYAVTYRSLKNQLIQKVRSSTKSSPLVRKQVRLPPD
jgi:glycosyltransferase involved in cell wall biosynthesis